LHATDIARLEDFGRLQEETTHRHKTFSLDASERIQRLHDEIADAREWARQRIEFRVEEVCRYGVGESTPELVQQAVAEVQRVSADFEELVKRQEQCDDNVNKFLRLGRIMENKMESLDEMEQRVDELSQDARRVIGAQMAVSTRCLMSCTDEMQSRCPSPPENAVASLELLEAEVTREFIPHRVPPRTSSALGQRPSSMPCSRPGSRPSSASRSVNVDHAVGAALAACRAAGVSPFPENEEPGEAQRALAVYDPQAATVSYRTRSPSPPFFGDCSHDLSLDCNDAGARRAPSPPNMVVAGFSKPRPSQSQRPTHGGPTRPRSRPGSARAPCRDEATRHAQSTVPHSNPRSIVTANPPAVLRPPRPWSARARISH